jgi:hypothetical protein
VRIYSGKHLLETLRTQAGGIFLTRLKSRVHGKIIVKSGGRSRVVIIH